MAFGGQGVLSKGVGKVWFQRGSKLVDSANIGRGNMKCSFSNIGSTEAMKGEKKITHFGFESVEEDKKASRVAEVFHSVANKYD
jgi:hypothetical protein